MPALGVHRVGGDDHSGQVGDGVQQGLEAGDLVGLLTDVHLGRDQAGGVLHGGEQVYLAAGCLGGAAQALAVHRHSAQASGAGRLRAAVSQPAADCSIQCVAVDAGHQSAHRRFRGHQPPRQQRITTDTEAFEHAGRGVGDPLADRQQ
ncbi:hypothetical protein UK12_22440 [Saccharothrix sp. ST-888]|nr:hypothetical protein [Saccharothrix sp. ST-888]KJK56437.1 hypothetical protein UK12_22440 [Saccharothrix sp. ST-888]